MVYELAQQDERIVFIGSDLGAGVLDDFKREMPDRFFMEGVGEANMVGMAAGLALSGKIVYCHTIATFLTRRAYEQIYVDVGMHHANVRLIGAGGGAVYAPLGPTHLATDDMALMRSVPGMTVISVCDAPGMEQLMPETVSHEGPIYIRLGRGGDPIVPRPVTTDGLPMKLRQGDGDVLLVTTGTVTQLAMAAAEALDAAVLYVPVVHPIDRLGLMHAACQAKRVVTIEDHSVIGGLGSAVRDALEDHPSVKCIGYPNEYLHGYGTQDEMRERYGLSADAIARKVNQWAN